MASTDLRFVSSQVAERKHFNRFTHGVRESSVLLKKEPAFLSVSGLLISDSAMFPLPLSKIVSLYTVLLTSGLRKTPRKFPIKHQPHRSGVARLHPQRGDAISRWMLSRKRYQKRRNAFLLLTLSGAIRPADVELPYCRERRLAKPSNAGTDAVPEAEPSLWSMDIRELVFRKARRPLSAA